jgi:lipocalin
MIKKSPEYFFQKREKRNELKEFLPEDLKLIYGHDIKPVKWSFKGELLKRRPSEEESDKLFFKALKNYNNNNKEIDEKLLEEKKGSKEKITLLLKIDQQLQKGLDECVNNNRWDDYINLLSKMAESGKATNQQLQKGLDECVNNNRWDDYINLLSKMAESGKATNQQLKKGLDELAYKGSWYNYANLLSKMAELGKELPEDIDKQLQKGLDECVNNNRWDDYINLLSKMAESGKATNQQLKKGLDELAYKGSWYNYANLLSKMAESGKATNQQLKKGLDELAYKGSWYNYANLLSKMAELGKATNQQLKKGLGELANNNRWDYYINLLSKMAELGKATNQQLQKSLDELANKGKWGDYTNLLSKMAEPGIIDFNNQEYQNINKWIDEQEESSFLHPNITSLLTLNKDVFKSQKENLASFQALRDLSVKVNEDIKDDDKKIEDVFKWFENNTKFLARLLSLGKLAEGLIKEKINNSIPSAEGMIISLKSAIYNDENLKIINLAVEKEHFSHPHDLEKFIEISSAFLKNNRLEELKELISEKSDKSLNERSSEKLLNIIVSELDIDSDKVVENDLSKWNIEFLSNLVSNKVIMDELIRQGDDGMKNAQELYTELLKATFEGRVNDFLYNPEQESEVGRDVARHNQKTKEIFTKLDIDYNKWIAYNKKHEFLVSTEVQVDNSKENLKVLKIRADEVLDKLSFFKDKMSEREYAPLTNILQGETNKKGIASAKKGELNNLYEKLNNSLNHLSNKKEYQNYTSKWIEIFEYLGHLKEAIDNVNKKEQKEIQTKEKGFQVKLWDRDPKKDLFQGNYSQCCIAVGQKEVPIEGGMTTHDPSTVMQFLSDTGMQVIEILDQDRKNPIGNTWLFVSKNDLGEPILVLDNVELHSDYTNNSHLKKTIRDNLFSFASQYAKDCNLAGAYLGLVGTNDVLYDDLEKESVPSVDKVDGYLKNYTSSNIRTGRYYLEAYNHNNLGTIYKQTEKQEIKINNGFIIINNLDGETKTIPYTQEVLDDIINNSSEIITNNDIEQIEEVETSIFDKDSAEDIEEILEVMQNTKGVQFLFKEKNNVVGYLSSLPASDFHPHIEHNTYDSSSNILYINAIAGKADSFSTLRLLKEKAKEAGYEKLSMHGINPRLNTLLTRLGFEPKELIKNWLGDKPAAYMEMDLKEKD